MQLLPEVVEQVVGVLYWAEVEENKDRMRKIITTLIKSKQVKLLQKTELNT